MKYDHTVKYNGVYYPAGVEVPAEVKPKVNKEVAVNEKADSLPKPKIEPKKSTKK